MDCTKVCSNYCQELKEDFSYTFKNRKEDKTFLKARITSIALRIIGGLVRLLSLVPAAFAICAFIFNPLSFIWNTALAVTAFVLSSDLIKMGRNVRTALKVENPEDRKVALLAKNEQGIPYYYADAKITRKLYCWTHGIKEEKGCFKKLVSWF